MFFGDSKKINAQITITATYEDAIRITVTDKASNSEFLEMVLTREQFINAALNRLGNTDVSEASVRSLDIVGKQMEMATYHFKLPYDLDSYADHTKIARDIAKNSCPVGWVPDTSFTQRGSFFTDDDGTRWVRTTIRRWV